MSIQFCILALANNLNRLPTHHGKLSNQSFLGSKKPPILTVLSLSGTCEISLLSSEGQRISPLTYKSSLAACSDPLNLLKQDQQNESTMLLHAQQSKQFDNLAMASM